MLLLLPQIVVSFLGASLSRAHWGGHLLCIVYSLHDVSAVSRPHPLNREVFGKCLRNDIRNSGFHFFCDNRHRATYTRSVVSKRLMDVAISVFQELGHDGNLLANQQLCRSTR